MGKVIVSMWLSLDGFAAGPGGELDWVISDPELQEYEQKLVDSASTLLLGRTTHAQFAGYWPMAAEDAAAPEGLRRYAQRLHGMPKVVVSGSGEVADWKNSRAVPGLDPDVARLREDDEGDAVVYGSLTLVQSLAAAGLVDEYHLLVHPVFLGSGRPLFAPDSGPVRLHLVDVRSFASGVNLATYRA